MTTDLLDFTLGWREALLGLIVLLAVYMMVVLQRMRRMRQPEAAASQSLPVEPSVAAAEPVSLEAETAENESLTYTVARTARVDAAMPEEFVQEVARELAQMREELDALRGEFAALREEWHQEAAHLRASQSVSPLYSDAMQMAMAGYGADVIAGRCGISRAEADLVIALSKQQEE